MTTNRNISEAIFSKVVVLSSSLIRIPNFRNMNVWLDLQKPQCIFSEWQPNWYKRSSPWGGKKKSSLLLFFFFWHDVKCVAKMTEPGLSALEGKYFYNNCYRLAFPWSGRGILFLFSTHNAPHSLYPTPCPLAHRVNPHSPTCELSIASGIKFFLPYWWKLKEYEQNWLLAKAKHNQEVKKSETPLSLKAYPSST